MKRDTVFGIIALVLAVAFIWMAMAELADMQDQGTPPTQEVK